MRVTLNLPKTGLVKIGQPCFNHNYNPSLPYRPALPHQSITI